MTPTEQNENKPPELELEILGEEKTEPEIKPEPVVPAAEIKPAPVVAQEPVIPDEPDDEEVRSYSDRVQARIKKLTADRHSERRARESISKQLDESVKITKAAIDESNRLKTLIHQGEGFWKETNKGRLQAQIDQARNAFKTAYDAGDAEAIANSQGELTRLNVELSNTNNWTPQPLPPTPVPTPPPPQMDQRAQDWQSKNDWFGKDVRMTALALGVHQDLVTSGVDPQSDRYYREIDAELHKHFPDKFGPSTTTVQSPAGGANVVAPANRSGKQSRKVQLTATQVALAKRFGLTNQQYAEEVLKLSND